LQSLAEYNFQGKELSMPHPLYETFESRKIISIVRGIRKEHIIQTVAALLEGGIGCIEITFDHSSHNGIKNTLDCLDAVSNHFGNQVLLGAGTVLTAEEVDLARKCNARYIISPNTDKAVITATKEAGMLSMPGALTPSEVVLAYNYGADIVKIFPIDSLGVQYLRAIKSPLKHIPVSAVGGVTIDNINTFLENGATCVGIGGNLVNTKLIELGQFEKLFLQTQAFCDRIK